MILDIDGVLITNPPWKADQILSDRYSEFYETCVGNLNELLNVAEFDIWLSSKGFDSHKLQEAVEKLKSSTN